ncbi:MAG TPA: CocE/NonD family hydrolase [Streptosporangiaceae bacterium]|nr:CocE/NonD family hydrolase [Streptosporangiaceae bacterium]
MPEQGVVRRFNVRIPLHEGISLSADLSLPETLPAPAVVVRTPYGKTGERQSKRGAAFAEAGYVYVHVDVRGRGDSDGVFQPYRNDGPDGAEVIAWAAAQEWCNGDVATYGGSYSGRIQWLTALQRPPALRAMVCMVTPSDPFVEFPTGLPTPMHINWYRLVDAKMPQYLDDVDWMTVYRHRPLLTMDEAAGFVSPGWREEVQHRTLDEWWEPVRYQHRITEVDVPVLHVSGWYDDEEVGTPANFAAMVAAGRAGQRLLMGPWGHAVNTAPTLGEVDFGPGAVIDMDACVTGFLDEHVRGRQPAAPAAPVRIFVMGANEWRDAQTWPPADATTTVWHFSSGGRANSRFGDGRLAEEAVTDEQPPDEWTHDPTRPVPFITGQSSAQIGGPDDYLGVEGRGDVLVYTSEPLTQPLEAIGPVTVVAHVDTSAADTDVTAKLLDVHPGGFTQRLCDGMVRLRYRDGFDREQQVTPGETYQVTISLWDTCVRLPAGHRLRIEVASSAFPKYDVNLGTNEDVTTATTGVLAHNRLWHTPSRPSRLILNGRG